MPADARIQPLLDRLVAGPLQPGAVMAVRRGDDLRLFAAGHMEQERRRPMRPDALFRISSMSKPIIALALLQLIEEGRLALADPVARFLPELAAPRVLVRIDGPIGDTVPAERPITVEDLLSSRMGMGILARPPGSTPIQREIERLGLPGFGPDDPANPMTADSWLAQLGTLPLLAQPGAAWFYNVSTLVQGILVARIAGRPLSAQIAERITAPLGMLDTGFLVPPEALDRLTAAYAADLLETDAPATTHLVRPQRLEASMVSTASDYAAFARMLQDRGAYSGGRLLGEHLVHLMLTDHLTPAQREGGAAFLDELIPAPSTPC
jgi:CubicO group peptidase (beta-lactamase class C family)